MLFCTLYSQKTPKERQTVTALAGCSGKGYKSDLSIYEYYNKLRVCVCVCVWGGGGGGVGGLMVSALVSGRAVRGHRAVVQSCLSPPGCMNGYRRIKCRGVILR